MKRDELAAMADDRVLEGVEALARRSNAITAELLAYLGEVEERRLYLREATSSMFVFCTERLHMAEGAAYKRIQAARAARRFPIILELIGRGEIHLAGIALLGPHLTEDNHAELLARARHLSKRAIEKLVAEIAPRPDVPPRVRALPMAEAVPPAAAAHLAGRAEESTSSCPRGQSPAALPADPAAEAASSSPGEQSPAALPADPSAEAASSSPRGQSRAAIVVGGPQEPVSHSPRGQSVTPVGGRPAVVAPLSARRYEIRVTVDQETYDRLRQLQDLFSHQAAGRDLAATISRSVEIALAWAMTRRAAVTGKPRAGRPQGKRSRSIPAAVRRQVWRRDGGRCAFLDGQGRRCSSTAFIQFHHLDNWAQGGEHSVARIELRCQAHNQYHAVLDYGAELMAARRRGSPAREPRAAYGSTARPMLCAARSSREQRHPPGSPPAGVSNSSSISAGTRSVRYVIHRERPLGVV